MCKHKRRNKAIDPDSVEEIDWEKSVKFIEVFLQYFIKNKSKSITFWCCRRLDP